MYKKIGALSEYEYNIIQILEDSLLNNVEK